MCTGLLSIDSIRNMQVFRTYDERPGRCFQSGIDRAINANDLSCVGRVGCRWNCCGRGSSCTLRYCDSMKTQKAAQYNSREKCCTWVGVACHAGPLVRYFCPCNFTKVRARALRNTSTYPPAGNAFIPLSTLAPSPTLHRCFLWAMSPSLHDVKLHRGRM
jgi:hypothetical protein